MVSNKTKHDVEIYLTFKYDRKNPPNVRLPKTTIQYIVSAGRSVDLLFLYKIDPFKEFGYFDFKFKVITLNDSGSRNRDY